MLPLIAALALCGVGCGALILHSLKAINVARAKGPGRSLPSLLFSLFRPYFLPARPADYPWVLASWLCLFLAKACSTGGPLVMGYYAETLGTAGDSGFERFISPRR